MTIRASDAARFQVALPVSSPSSPRASFLARSGRNYADRENYATPATAYTNSQNQNPKNDLVTLSERSESNGSANSPMRCIVHLLFYFYILHWALDIRHSLKIVGRWLVHTELSKCPANFLNTKFPLPAAGFTIQLPR